MAFAAPILPYLMAGGAALGAIGSYQSSMYQAAVAGANAQNAANMAMVERAAADQDMADKDAEARQTIAGLIAEMDASGLVSNSGSMLLRREGLQSLADRDRERLAQKRDVQFENRKREEAAFRSQQKGLKSSARIGLLGNLLAVPTSFLSGASMVNDYNRSKAALTAPSYA